MIGTSQNEIQKKKRIKNKNRTDYQRNVCQFQKMYHIYIYNQNIRREKEAREIFEEIIAENFQI